MSEGSCYDIFRNQYESSCSGDCSNKECSFENGDQVCTCMMCPTAAPNQLVCGSDGRNYPSQCILKRSNCEFNTQVEVARNGPCAKDKNLPTDNGCGNCEYGGVCVNGLCKCDFYCSNISAPVCGSNGELFKNECYLRQQACIEQSVITIADIGTCEECSNNDISNCPIYSISCDSGKCQCPTCKNVIYEQVCGSDGEYYQSSCHLRQHACLQRQMLFEVPCDDQANYDRSDYSSYESSGDLDCRYGSTPSYGDDEDCVCDWHCPPIANAYRDTNGDIYQNECFFYRDGKCATQSDLKGTRLCGLYCDNSNTLDSQVCDINGDCLCQPRHVGTTCQTCPEGYYKTNEHCAFCGCSTVGSLTEQCDENGECVCKSGYNGIKCDKLTDASIETCAKCHDSERRSGQICASDNRFYPSICMMKKINCVEPPLTGMQPYPVMNDVCLYSHDTVEDNYTKAPSITKSPISITTPPPTIPPTAPPTIATTTTTTKIVVPPMSSIYYPYDPVDEDGSGDLNDISDDDDFIPEGSGNYDIYEPDLEPIDNYMGKHEPDTYVEINRAEYQIKIHLSESTIRGEELLETATDKVKSILQSMIPDIKEV